MEFRWKSKIGFCLAVSALLWGTTASAGSGVLEEGWTLSRDYVQDGIIDLSSSVNHITLSSHQEVFSGVHTSVQNDAIISGSLRTLSNQPATLIEFKEASATNRIIHLGKKISDSVYEGIWYGVDGQSGDFRLQKINTGTPTCSPVTTSGRFIKIDADGCALDDTAPGWACVTDTVTGLMWEEKTIDYGLQDASNTFSHYHPSTPYSGDVGVANNGTCAGGISCDTANYTEAVNQMSLCGSQNWRLPSATELLGLVDNGFSPKMNSNYFQNHSATGGHKYWSSTQGNLWDSQHAVDFTDGSNTVNWKGKAYKIRLVRPNQ